MLKDGDIFLNIELNAEVLQYILAKCLLLLTSAVFPEINTKGVSLIVIMHKYLYTVSEGTPPNLR